MLQSDGHKTSQERANIVSRYLVADAVSFLLILDKLNESFPEISQMTNMLAAKAGAHLNGHFCCSCLF